MRLRSILINWRMIFCQAYGIFLMVLGITMTILNVLCEPARRDYAQVAVSIILVVLGYDILMQRKLSFSSIPAISK